MPVMKRRAWTPYRKLMGNIVPGLFAFPCLAVGLWMFRPESPFQLAPLIWVAAFPIVGWVALAYFGLFGNAQMRSEVGRSMDRQRGPQREERLFVGYARPEFRSILDAHEDVGFLIFGPEDLEYFGEAARWSLKKQQILAVGLKPNIHSLVGLGGWIEIKTVDRIFLIEPRERNSLIGNRGLRRATAERIDVWRRD